MNRIRELRKSRGLSQVQLAAQLKVHQTAVSQWETGRTEPDMESARLLADFFQVSIDHLLGHDRKDEELDDVYLNLARAARDRDLQLDERDIDFILDFAQRLKDRDRRR